MQRLLIALSLTMVALSGCTESPAPADGVTTESTDDATGNVTAVNNTAPVVSLSGIAHNLTVNFTLQITDVDGDNVTWSFDAGADGSIELDGVGPATFNHTFPSEGNHSVLLQATDGEAIVDVELSFNLTVDRVVIEYAPGQTASGSFPAGGATLIGCFGDIFGVGFPEDLEGIAYAQFDVEPHTVGYAYSAAVSAPVQDSPGFAFLDAARETITSGFMSTHGAGFVPEGAAYGVWWT